VRWAAVLLFGGCGSYYGDLPLGWRGTIPTCDEPRVDGTAMVRLDTGFLEAVAPGTVTLRCKGGTRTRVGIREVARLEIDGPTAVAAGGRAGYYLRAYAADGGELRFADPALDLIEWSTSWPEDEARIDRAYCHEPIFACPDSDYARLFTWASGPLTISAELAGRRATLEIVVR
jgi:hypothetical protein